jgi:LPS sulfotransferase NodH
MSTHQELGYFEAKFDTKKPCPTSFRYIIFSSQRTGSNYLCSRLSNLKDVYGIPMEYLHPAALETFRKRLAPGLPPSGKSEQSDLLDHIQLVERARTTPDGCFGIKVQPKQLLHITGSTLSRIVNFLNRFDKLIFMTRRDKLDQAVSGAIAKQTNTWFNFNEEPDLDMADISSLFPIIAKRLLRDILAENLILLVEHQLADKPSMHIYYEDIQHDPDAVFRTIIAFLGTPDMASLSEDVLIQPTKKPTGLLAEKVRNAFMEYISGRSGLT